MKAVSSFTYKTMERNLTTKQSKVLSAIRDFIGKKGVSPTFEELREILAKKGLELKSNNSVVQYLNVLEEKGFIQKFSKKRGIRVLTGIIKNFIPVPLMGQADCGEALNCADNRVEDYINISKEYVKGNKNDYFFVKASGDSMNLSGIKSGDLVLVKKIEGEPSENQDIIAVINGLGTIKKFRKVEGTPVLVPNSTNLRHQPIILHPDDQIYICGKVERVFNFSTMEK